MPASICASPIQDRRAARRAAIRQLGYDIDEVLAESAQTSAFLCHTVVVRIADAGRTWMSAEAQVAFAELCLQHDINVPPPLAVHSVAGFEVTCWQYVPHASAPVSGQALSQVLRRIHQLSVTEVTAAIGHPPANVFGGPLALSRSRIAELGRLAGPHVEWLEALQDALDRIQLELSNHQAHMPMRVLHGDANYYNMWVDASGQLVLCDLECVFVGPPGWDVASPAAERSLGRRDRDWCDVATHSAIADPETRWHLPALVHLRALDACVYGLLQVARGARPPATVRPLVAWIRRAMPIAAA